MSPDCLVTYVPDCLLLDAQHTSLGLICCRAIEQADLRLMVTVLRGAHPVHS